jgi:TatD DNase family protein
MLFDSHAHLNLDRFNRDRHKLISDFKKDGIEMVVVPGTSVENSTSAVLLAEKYPSLFATVGIHPVNTGQLSDKTIEALRNLAKSKKVVAIGECGLDYHYDDVPRDTQKIWFIEQIRLAKELDLPLVVHDREANIDTFNILESEADKKLRGVLHCYSGDVELAKQYVKMGFYLSIAGPVTYKSAQKLKAVAREIPLEYLLVETDAPCLTPSYLGKRRNEPAFVRYVVGEIAELKGIAFEKVEIQTNKNAKRIFGITG